MAIPDGARAVRYSMYASSSDVEVNVIVDSDLQTSRPESDAAARVAADAAVEFLRATYPTVNVTCEYECHVLDETWPAEDDATE